MGDDKVGDTYRNQQQYIFLDYAKRFLGVPYEWGGDDILGIDCSGLVIECLKACGIVRPHDSDMTANDMWVKYSQQYKVMQPQACALAFWFNADGKATHVAICTTEYFCITADGGGSTTHTVQDADEQNAFVKYRPIDHRKSKPQFVYLFA